MKTTSLCKAKSTTLLRNSNLELYRIISMLLIIAHHYVVNSGLTAEDGPVYSNLWSLPSQFLLVFGSFGKIGINCFVLITGYFMCKSQITAKKFVKLFFELMFYKLVLFSVFWISGYEPFTIKSFLYAIVPFKSISQNFTGTFLMFYLSIPFLNILVNNMSEKQHVRLLLLCSFIYIILGSVPLFTVTMNYVSWYIVLYFIASYIRLYPKNIYNNTKLWGYATLCCVIISMLSVTFCSWLKTTINIVNPFFFVADSNKLLAVLTGLSSFMFFKNIHIKQSKFINVISSTTFGVLLIHANSDVMRRWLWGDVCNNVGAYNSAFLPIHAIACVLIIFIVCSFIELLRMRFVEKPLFALWDKHYPHWASVFSDIENKILGKLNIGDTAE